MNRKEFIESLTETESLAQKIRERFDIVQSKSISRRSFLKGSILASGTFALSASGFNILKKDPIPKAKAQSQSGTMIQIKGNSDRPLNYYFETTGPIRTSSFEQNDFEEIQDQSSETDTETQSGYIQFKQGEQIELNGPRRKRIVWETDHRFSEQIVETSDGIILGDFEISMPGDGDTEVVIQKLDRQSQEILLMTVSGSGPVNISNLVSDTVEITRNGSKIREVTSEEISLQITGNNTEYSLNKAS